MATSFDNKVVKLSQTAVACNHCSLHNLCAPPSLDRSAIETLDRIIRKRRPINRGEFLFRAGDPLPSIFCVRSGSVKTFTTTDDGAEMVTGFHLPGELLGLNGISSRISPSSAVALETSSVCEIPLERIEDIRTQLPELQTQLLKIMSSKILHMQSLMLLLSRKSAEERLAALLISLSSRFKQRGFSPSEFYLSMSRNDIANYLGMAVETVSRVFTRFDEEGLLTVRRKYIHLHDTERLKQLAGNPKHQDQLLAFP